MLDSVVKHDRLSGSYRRGYPVQELPPFTHHGHLPPGDYRLTLNELANSSLVLGPGPPAEHPVWDEAWRLRLVELLSIVVRQLWQVGIDEVFIDGSFVEDKDHPNDIDGYFVCDPRRLATGELERELNRIDPAKSWTWDHRSRRAYRGYPKLQLPMWHTYRVELYPHCSGRFAGVDEHGHPLEFPAFFRRCRRNDEPKGIVRILPDRDRE